MSDLAASSPHLLLYHHRFSLLHITVPSFQPRTAQREIQVPCPLGMPFLFVTLQGKKKNYSYSVFPQEAVAFESLTLSLRGTKVQQSHWPLGVTNFNFLHLVTESSRATEDSQDHWVESDADSKPSSAGNYIQYPVINQDGKEYKKEYSYMYV